ncbi:required for meiotic nuclear division protein 1 homolog [Diorhabda carinulata]|uniref:required for meiotic nuclear division protein 1 homolog n=1 Tax=Diorhabda sublineata TaxID=1163346 RepID=UPI0024E104AE|nr:required for meiotic nuclear division protein 1 homolog [Diorhabda sublineata]XP_057653732.1 required for meiotic nuclear division protein 1 homolog [Diorhabda carinulata]
MFKTVKFCLISLSRHNQLQVIRNLCNKSNLFQNILIPNIQVNSNFNSSSVDFNLTNTNVPKPLSVHDTITSIQLKKRVIRKKKSLEEEEKKPGNYNVVAFATAEEYNLENLFNGLVKQNLYEVKKIDNNSDALHATAKYKVDREQREIFFFRDGSVVFWNIADLESSNVLEFLKQYEEDSYSERLVQSEYEIMNYKYFSANNKTSCIDKDGHFILSPSENDSTLTKYTFSNAMMLSVKLGIWESSLERYIDEIEFVTNDLKDGKITKLSRQGVLKKQGELFALRHYLNLSSDALDTPDFYWDNEELENLYNQVCNYFCINKRSKVMNEKINYCVALIELLSFHLSDKHHERLEWMIIALIAVEVAFEIIHYIDKYAN